MIAAWREVPTPPSVTLPDVTRASLSDAGAIAVIWGWTARVARTAEAALILHREGFDIGASPLLRSMLEHAIALSWVADKRGRAYQALARERADGWAQFKAAQSESWTLEGEAAALLGKAITVETDEDTLSQDYLLKTFHRAQTYSLGSLYQGWLIETWSTHATMLSAEPFFEVEPGTHKGKLFRVGSEPDNLQVAGTIALAVHTSLATYEQIDEAAFPGRLREWETTFEKIVRDAKAS
jgi:hypothetical protein